MNRREWLASLAIDSEPSIDECISFLGDVIDWLHLLESTEQDSEWHAEGNVKIHTSMVLDELYKLLKHEAKHVSGPQRQALVLAALLHDIGKPTRSRRFDIDGVERIGAPQHAEVGRSYLAFKLTELELSFEQIWVTLNLVGEHHSPKKLVVRNGSRADYLRLSRQANTELLYWLEIADIRGRICPDPEKQLEFMEEFRLYAEEYSVWGSNIDVRTELTPFIAELPCATKEYVFAHAISQLESGKIYLAEEAIATTYQYRNEHPHLIVLCGPSGSGKTSWLKRNCGDYALISLDDLRQQVNGDRESQANRGQIMQLAKELLREALRKNAKVVWDATNLRSDFRSIVCGLGRDYHALVSLVVFLQSEAQFRSNNQKRQRSVPNKILEKQISSYQFPLLAEAHQFQVIDSQGLRQYASGIYADHETKPV